MDKKTESEDVEEKPLSIELNGENGFLNKEQNIKEESNVIESDILLKDRCKVRLKELH